MLCCTGDALDLKPEVKIRRNCRIKQYKDGSKNYIVCVDSIFRDPYDENIEEDKHEHQQWQQNQRLSDHQH